jgi:hypothetical protein
MADYSWIEPATKNIAGLFGLNPEAAAKGRAMQSEQEYNAARTANTQADTGLSDYRRRLLEAQAATQGAMAGNYGAQATHTGSKTKAQEMRNTALGNILSAGAKATKPIVGQDGKTYYVFDPEEYRNKLSPADTLVAFGNSATDAERSLSQNQSRSLITSGDADKVRTGTILSGQAAAGGRPNFAPNSAIAQAIIAQQQGADQARSIAVQKERNKGSIAQSLAKGQTPGQPSKRDLLNEAEAIKIGAGYAQTVPQNGLKLDEVQALQLSRAAQAANPNLNPQDAIDKFVRDNPGMIKDGGWFSGNTFNIPPTERAAPAVRAPVAPAAQEQPAVHKGAPSMSMATDNRQPAPQTAPAQVGKPTKGQFMALPEGAPWVADGIKYIKRGGQLVPVQ